MPQEPRVTVYVLQPADRDNLQLQWRDPDTRRRRTRSAGTDDPRKAERARADLEYELNRGQHREPARLSWATLRELFEAEHVAGLRPKSRDTYAAALDLFERLCEPGQVRNITARTLSRFAAEMKALGHARSSIAQRLRMVRKALRWGKGQGLVGKVPRGPAVRVPKKKPQPVDEADWQRLLARAPDEETRVLLLACWLAGLRREEAHALEWDRTDRAPWVDFRRHRITLPAEFAKADEDQWVPLDPELEKALLALPRAGRHVFPLEKRHGAGRLSERGLTERVLDLARAAGVELDLRALRRGFVSRHAAHLPAQVVQKLARHADIKTTIAYYAAIDRAVEEAVRGPLPNEESNAAP